MISLKNNFLFIHIPKTAGNSIQNVLITHSEDRIVCLSPHQDGIERFGIKSDRFNTHKHSSLQEYSKQIEEETFGKLFKFTCVRNPWDRMISLFFSPHRGPRSWDRKQFIKLVKRAHSVKFYISLSKGIFTRSTTFDNIDYFIRFENLNEDFKNACAQIGIPWKELPIRNKSAKKPYMDYYDQELKEIVAKEFADEIHYFGYKFNHDN